MTDLRGDGVVEFRFFRPDANDVRIAGDFNKWCRESLPMEPAEEGWWVARQKLPAGEYRFRYVADGRWFTDFAAHGVEMDRAEWNSVLVVPRKAQ